MYHATFQDQPDSQGEWDDDRRPPQQEISLWEDERMSCFKALGQWDILAQNVLIQVDDKAMDLWNQPVASRDAAIGHFLQSALHQPKEWQELANNFLDESLKVAKHKKLLQSRFAPELISLTAMRPHSFAMARLFVKDYLENFRTTWSSLSPLGIEARHAKLYTLQPIVEVEEFLKLRTDPPGQFTSGLVTLLGTWNTRCDCAFGQ